MKNIKNEILDQLGYILCEASFRWWNWFDVPAHQWKRRHNVLFWLGRPSYRLGCFFYSLQDNDWGLGLVVDEDEYDCSSCTNCSCDKKE